MHINNDPRSLDINSLHVLRIATSTIAVVAILLTLQGFTCQAIEPLVSEAESKLPDGLIGWASVEGGTSGGKSGKTVTADDAESFTQLVQSTEPLIIQVSGTIKLSGMVRIASHKTIVGVGSQPTITGGGLNLRGAEQVIIRRLFFTKSSDDAINIENDSHHVWIDHCDLSAAKDGLLDIKHGSDLITVSWCRFHDHHKSCLLGHSDKAKYIERDKGKLRVTYHHNFFDGTQTRHPRVRTGEPVHVWNNYFRDNDYGIASTANAGVVVEGNYFHGVEHPTHTQYGSSAPGRLVERENIYVQSGEPQTRGSVQEPKDHYEYQLDRTADIPRIITSGAGVPKGKD